MTIEYLMGVAVSRDKFSGMYSPSVMVCLFATLFASLHLSVKLHVSDLGPVVRSVRDITAACDITSVCNVPVCNVTSIRFVKSRS